MHTLPTYFGPTQSRTHITQQQAIFTLLHYSFRVSCLQEIVCDTGWIFVFVWFGPGAMLGQKTGGHIDISTN